MEKLILASSSPRRKTLLRKITNDFEIKDPLCNEVEDGEPQFVAETNAALKGRAVEGDFVLSCDTVVCMDGKIYGKPQDESHAVEMLSALSGRTHEVVSGVYIRYHGKEIVFSDVTRVTFKKLTEKEIRAYVKEYRPLDKAGSYGIQDGVTVEKYEGSLDNVIGLPTERLREVLKDYVDIG